MSDDITGVLGDLDADKYHNDAISKQPSLSKSVMHILLEQSPAHARAAHPRLNPGFKRQEEEKFDVGNCVHSLLLEGVDKVAIIAADSWRTNAAKEERDVARAAGKIPLLERQFDVVQEMLIAVTEQIAAFPCTPKLLAEGRPEQTIVWDEDGVLCRARLDWLHDDHSAIDDIKSTGRSGSPESWSRSAVSIGADVQEEFYRRGARAVLGCDPLFRFVVVEAYPPFEVSVFDVAPSARALAKKKVDRALAIWKRCLERNDWPGYPKTVCSIEAPAWAENAFYEGDWREAA